MWLIVSGLAGALAVVAGAFGAHGLRGRLAPESLQVWATASQYHLLHSVALLALALYAAQSGRSVALPAGLLTAGIVLFSGSLYGLALTRAAWLGPITPLGGLCLVAGWLAMLLLARGA